MQKTHIYIFILASGFALVIGNKRWNMSWETMISKMTSGPADHIGLLNRGRIAQGFAADVVIFNPAKIASRSRFKNPFRYPVGITHVLVNGSVAVNPKGLTGTFSGQTLRRKH